jgi:hypothetical protein
MRAILSPRPFCLVTLCFWGNDDPRLVFTASFGGTVPSPASLLLLLLLALGLMRRHDMEVPPPNMIRLARRGKLRTLPPGHVSRAWLRSAS